MDNKKKTNEELGKQENKENQDKTRVNGVTKRNNVLDEWIPVPYEEDYKNFDLYKKAADEGDIEAQFVLGFMYEHGKNIEQNYVKHLDGMKRRLFRDMLLRKPFLVKCMKKETVLNKIIIKLKIGMRKLLPKMM